jgi:hypothetical protein
MISFRRCSQRTPPKQEFEHLTCAATTPCGAQDETEEEAAAE